jgi:predicted nucleic-acid-binding Zn-ribbon protein
MGKVGQGSDCEVVRGSRNMSANNITVCPKCENETLVERYEQGIGHIFSMQEYNYYVTYKAHCRECGWEFPYEHKILLPDKI